MRFSFNATVRSSFAVFAFFTLFVMTVIAAVVRALSGQDLPAHSHDGRSKISERTPSTYQSAGTKKMAMLLAKIYQESDWKDDPTKQAERAVYYSSLLQRNLSTKDEAAVRLEMAKELLRAGDSAAAVAALEELRKLAAGKAQMLTPEMSHDLGKWLAISYLRLGEQENCKAMHGQGACIFPIGASGVHQLPRGAEGAIREFSALLRSDKGDSEAQWLLNLAYMQLGQYPQKVPKQWLISSERFRSEQDLGEFPDYAAKVGLDITNHAGGVLMEDFDRDGRLDIMVSSSGPSDQMRLFHNNGDGTFSDVTQKSGLMGETGGLNLVVTDYNNDGFPDVLVLRGGWMGKYGHYPMSLLRNNGDGTFDDVTEEAGLMSLHPTQTAAWADYDNDGYLDLFVGHESSKDDPNPSQLFHNNGDGTFTDVAAALGLANLGYVKGVAWGDYNNDGRPDLYVSVLGAPNRLFRNDGSVSGTSSWSFADVTDKAGVAAPIQSFATWFFDYDNDGWPDIFVAGYSAQSMQDVGAFEIGKPFQAETPRLYHNNHDGTFTDVTREMHLNRAILTMGASFGDLDNDGFLDVYLGTGEPSYEALLPNRMFRNDGGQRFLDVTTSGGFGNLQKGHAIAFGDLESNGNEDVFEEMGGALPGDSYQSMLYHNPGHQNHWITLRLEGVQTNRAAFGAKICLTVTTKGGTRKIFRTVGYGSSFGGNPLEQHIGIGDANVADRIDVFWPTSGLSQHFDQIPADRRMIVRESSQQLENYPSTPATN